MVNNGENKRHGARGVLVGGRPGGDGQRLATILFADPPPLQGRPSPDHVWYCVAEDTPKAQNFFLPTTTTTAGSKRFVKCTEMEKKACENCKNEVNCTKENKGNWTFVPKQLSD